MGFPERRGSRNNSFVSGNLGTVTLPPRVAGDLILVWVSSAGTATLTKASGWEMLLSGSNPGSGTSGLTGAIFARIIDTTSATSQSGVQVFTSSVSTVHTYIVEVVTKHKVSAISDVKLTAVSAGNITGSGSITYNGYTSGALVATEEYLIYGMVAGRDGDSIPTSTSANWSTRESSSSGTASTDTFMSTQTRQVTGVTSLTINSHAAIAATGYWAGATIAVPGAATASGPGQGSASGSVVVAGSAVGARPATGPRGGSASGAVVLSGQAVGARPGGSSGTTVPTRAQMPASPFALYPAPAMSWAVGSAPSGAGYTSVGPDSPLIQLLGAARKGVQAGSVSGFVNPAPLQDIAGAGTGTNPLVFPAFGKRILTNSPEVWFRLGQRSYAGFSNVSARAASRLRVNRKWVASTPVYLGSTLGFPANPENITAGEYAYKLTFPDSQLREIELNDHLEFGGVVIPSAYTLSTPRPAEHVLVLLDGSLGASEKHQTGNFSLSGADGPGAPASYTAVTSYIWSLAQILGYDSVVNVSAGSSGFSISGDTASWKSSNKVPVDVLEHLGDLNIIGSANNDQAAGQSASQVDVASNTVYGLVAAGAKPTAVNVALGMFTAPAMGSQSAGETSVAPYNAVLKARAQQNGLWFVNPTTGQTYDPQGNLVLTTSNWVYQDLSDVSSDNTHPIQRGAHNLGSKVAAAIVMAHPAGSSVVPSGSASGAVTVAGTAQGSKPGGAVTAVYGPTGQHWPDNTPRFTDAFGYDVTVSATFDNIAAKIAEACLPENASKVARIRVTPGSLVGFGAGSTSTPVMQNVGMVDRPGGRILIIPRDGVGSVNVTEKSARIHQVAGASMIGFNTWAFGQPQVDGNGVLLTGCKDFAYGWAKAFFWNVGNRSDVVTDRVQFVEMVANESFLYPEPDENGEGSGAADRIQWYNSTSGGSGASGQADRVEVVGCFMSPVRVWQNDEAHLDGLQIYGTGAFTNVLLKDSVMYAASHQGFIVNEPTTIVADHSLLVGGDTANDTQFPLEPNASVPVNPGAPWPTNGAPASGVAQNNTRLFGSPKGWPTAYDSTSYQQGRTTLAYLNENAPVPTDARLRAMWSFASAPSPASAALSGSGSLGVVMKPTVSRAAVLSGTGSLSAQVAPSLVSAAVLTGSGVLTASAVPAISTPASTQGAGSLSVTGGAVTPDAAALSGSGVLAVSAPPMAGQSVSLTGSGGISGGATPSMGAVASLGGSGSISGGAGPTVGGSIPLSGAGALQVVAFAGASVGIALGGSGQLASVGGPGVMAAVSLIGTGELFATGAASVAPAVAYTGAGQLAATSGAAGSQALAFAGAGSLQVAWSPAVGVAASLSGSGALGVPVNPSVSRTVGLAGSGSLVVAARATVAAAAPLTGSGAIEVATGSSSSGAASFNGASTLQATRTASASSAVALTGGGQLQAPMVPTFAAVASLAGVGQMSAFIRPLVAVSVVLAGSGSLLASASGASGAASDLSGSGHMTYASQPAIAVAAVFGGSGALVVAVIARSDQRAQLLGAGQLSVLAGAVFVVLASGTGQLTVVTSYSIVRLKRFMHLGRRDTSLTLTVRD